MISLRDKLDEPIQVAGNSPSLIEEMVEIFHGGFDVDTTMPSRHLRGWIVQLAFWVVEEG